jgi:hypothetical protein
MKTITLEVPEDQVVEWIRGLPPETKHALVKALVPALDDLNRLVEYGDERIRALCAERGIDWGSLGETERERLVDEILHEE